MPTTLRMRTWRCVHCQVLLPVRAGHFPHPEFFVGRGISPLARLQMLDVNFSFFDPQPQDYHSIKLLLSQLVGHADAAGGGGGSGKKGEADLPELDLGAVADLILEQKLVGSTVKTDSGEDDDKANEGDPYAFLTVLNLNVHKVRVHASLPVAPASSLVSGTENLCRASCAVALAVVRFKSTPRADSAIVFRARARTNRPSRL